MKKFRVPIWALGLLVALVAVELSIHLEGRKQTARINELARAAKVRNDELLARTNAAIRKAGAEHAAEIAALNLELARLTAQLADRTAEVRKERNRP